MISTLGVEHIGVGATDLEESKRFYSHLGFTEVALDYEGPLPGMEAVARRNVEDARVVVLRNPNAGMLGLGTVKLVQVLDAPVPPLPDGIGWGERGICEVCVHVIGEEALHRELVHDRGYPSLMDSVSAVLTPNDTPTSLSYVADPDGGKVELIEWPSLTDGWPARTGPQGVNHVAFGVADIERTRAFYGQFGFADLLFESDGYFEPMHPWYPGAPPRQQMLCLLHPRGAGIEPVQHHPRSPDMRGRWGHAGPMDFGIGVRNLERAIRESSALGIEFLSEPMTVEGSDGQWRYAYFVDPDGLYVCLSEARF